MSLQKKEYLSCHELLKDRLAKLVLIGRPNDQMREKESKMNNDILTFDAETAINKIIIICFTVLP